MGIWKNIIQLDDVEKLNANTLSSHLGIKFTEIGEDFLSGSMPVDQRTKQPYGIMHGGASCVLAETLGSLAGNFCIEFKTHVCVGLSINTNHIRMANKGLVHGKATPIHIGKKNHVWEVRIVSDEGKLVSVTRLTLAVIERK